MKHTKVPSGEIKIKVDKVLVEGRGAIILTGPSSCGKGEIAKELRRFLNLPKTRHLSMGDILRLTISRARSEDDFREKLSSIYGIDEHISIFDTEHNIEGLSEKALKHADELQENYDDRPFVSQLDWLEFCVSHGLLIPDEWTVNIINATFEMSQDLQNDIFILDGYPRTKKAAEELMNTFVRFDIPIIKVIHLSITKNEMMRRAMGRNRLDDQMESLERRYQFYVESVQPSIDYLKTSLSSKRVVMVDAHQPVYDGDGKFLLHHSIQRVTIDVLEALGLPKYLLMMDN